jgi:hypothetical protein
MFSEANNWDSISIIQFTFLEFEHLSGLKTNLAKSSLLCSGISTGMKSSLLDRLKMKEDHFPIRYLGVPLVSTKLSAIDCKTLIDRIISPYRFLDLKESIFCWETSTSVLCPI